MNYSDAERIAAVLDSLGYEKTEKETEADLFIVVSCSVRQSAINRIYGKVKDLKDRKMAGKSLTTILSGCVLAGDKKKLGRAFDIMFDIKDLKKLPEMIQSHKDYTSDKNIETEATEYFSITPNYESTFRAYVPISTGCDNFCSYCAVPYTKGREKSRPMEQIISEFTTLIQNGYKEITLLGQNVNSYGHDLTGNKKDNSPFIELLQKIDEIPGEHRIYFYSNHPKDMTNELIQTIGTLKHFPPYIHLPLQSGNNEILREMNRHNTKEEYLNLVERIRNILPNVTLTTDIIVGYPGETLEQFSDTADVMKKAEFDMAFIAQYSPREGTASAKQPDDITKTEKMRREKELQEIVKQTVLEHNQELIGTKQRVLVDESKNGKYYGRTEGYKVVEIKTDQPLEVGQFIDIEIKSVSSWKLSNV